MVFLAIFFAPFRSQALRCLNVLRLCAFVSAAQKNDDGVASLFEVNPVAGAIIDAQFADAKPYRLHIPSVPKARRSRRDAIRARIRWSLRCMRHFRKVWSCLNSIITSAVVYKLPYPDAGWPIPPLRQKQVRRKDGAPNFVGSQGCVTRQ